MVAILAATALMLSTDADVRPLAPAAPFQMSVSVSDSRGRPVKDLTAADFSVKVGSSELLVAGATLDTRPVSIVLIIDGVESTEVLDARAALTEVLKQFRSMAEGVRLGMILGDAGATVPELQDANEATAEHNRRVSVFFQAPQTAPPIDTLRAATEALMKEENRRRAILVLSLNRRTASQQYLGDVANGLGRADILLGAVETGRGSDQSLWLIHDAVGGRHERVGDVASLALAGGRLARALLSSYQVTFDSSGPLNERPRVEVKTRKGLTVIAPAWARRPRA
ncbi:MAG: hypothetical protein EXQ49_11955 [Acidobacteria bacterium]|nr:hypothetical protein [Acidobacteriota bacterium]